MWLFKIIGGFAWFCGIISNSPSGRRAVPPACRASQSAAFERIALHRFGLVRNRSAWGHLIVVCLQCERLVKTSFSFLIAIFNSQGVLGYRACNGMTISRSALRRPCTLSCTVFSTLALKYRVPHFVYTPAGTFSMNIYWFLILRVRVTRLSALHSHSQLCDKRLQNRCFAFQNFFSKGFYMRQISHQPGRLRKYHLRR